ncbi:kinase-like domain-containing protein [Rhizophagus irregularis DAOM 181602=DAOM 197198]|uniref:Kcc4p n=2 Tax=Rhizophagus irregularis TaxID=588596 RepID=A0A015J7Z1_RHIIW|nr:kinase-like domain-containing protein [Rhizophagus irregularis DAOM 181602=DAOM 197198]EXX62980.1 Kcc4p [Rhizophagus irregularis DAOM 197198w]POG58871.1 kinase-like domain-containing protein [Rhizophagus irregularis DAOM 181602=DAOM 197198]GBC14399.1 kinase-like domain-containing protein [Rhizophagus irregularis DAOM 181602=DAOM 197198]|eukprot:XP_025165737.1 kinase-like domain-containing protein [Rhizophagus irregularis DAOM 181602=DAOM 197198]
MDQFISKNKLKWIPYDKFENINKYSDKKGFSTIYEAKYKEIKVILKDFDYLNNSNESLNEWKIIDSDKIIRIYGFTKNPDTLNYILIMEYTNKGNLRKCLTEITKTWKQKLFNLYKIIDGLNDIHKEDLIHYNFYDDNILCHEYEENMYGIYISDYLGLHQLTKSLNNIYGIIPFMAPEILKGQSYTQASNIYSFSMIMWEFTSGISPFNDKAHDNLQLALDICKGECPEIIKNTPQCYVDLMEKCWNEDPLKRPSASKILNIIKNWISFPLEKKIEDINEELKSNIMEFINASSNNYINHIVNSYSQIYYTSHLHNFTSKDLNEILFLKLKQELFKLEKIAEINNQNFQNEHQMEKNNLQIQLVQLKANI